MHLTPSQLAHRMSGVTLDPQALLGSADILLAQAAYESRRAITRGKIIALLGRGPQPVGRILHALRNNRDILRIAQGASFDISQLFIDIAWHAYAALHSIDPALPNPDDLDIEAGDDGWQIFHRAQVILLAAE